MYRSEKPKDRKKLNPVLVVLAVLCAALLLFAAVAAGFILKSINTPPETSDFFPVFNTDKESSKDGEEAKDIEPTRKENFYNFLVIGTDKVGLNTDTIMIVSLDCENGRCMVLQLPRDTYIRYDGAGCKVNSILPKLYANFQDTASDPYDSAAREFANVLQEALCIPIDYYALVELDCLKEVVDIIGGVTIDIPRDMYYVDKKQDLYIDLKAGVQTLNGDQAEQFIRYRSGYIQADIGRIDAQKVFMTALLSKVKNDLTLSQLCDAATAVYKKVTTSISLSDALYFASVVYDSVDMSNIVMKTIQGEAYQNGIYYVIYKEAAYETVNKYFNAYSLDIPYSSFDMAAVFTNGENSEIEGIYRSTVSATDGKTAEEIDDSGIYIPRLN